ncbi:hypothetical protein ACWC9T_31760 [Kitasatospora sp. NPDC001159]
MLAALLARRGLRRGLVTDANPRALVCARDNAQHLGLADRVETAGTALYPPGDQRAALIVCNPPWLPARPSSSLVQGVYDQDSRMLHGFLGSLADRLLPGGEGWLVLSDLAEHLGLRTRTELLTAIAGAGLRVSGRLDTVPRHPRAIAPDRSSGGAGLVTGRITGIAADSDGYVYVYVYVYVYAGDADGGVFRSRNRRCLVSTSAVLPCGRPRGRTAPAKQGVSLSGRPDLGKIHSVGSG